MKSNVEAVWKSSMFVFAITLISIFSPAMGFAEDSDQLAGSDEYAGSAYEYSGAYDQARLVGSSTAAYDAGSSPSDTRASGYPVGDVPEVGPSGPVDTSNQSGN